MKHRIYQDNKSRPNKGLNLSSKLSFKNKLKIGASATGLGLLSIATILFPTTNQLASALSIKSLSQTSGSLAGGNEITIAGDGFRRDQYYLGEKVKQVARSVNSGYLLTESGQVYDWGLNDYGQLGTGDTNNQLKPIEITNKFNGDKIVKIIPGHRAVLMLSDTGNLYGMGANAWGFLGYQAGTVNKVTAPFKINDVLNGEKIADAAINGESAIYLTTDGKAYFAGSDDNVPLNTGDTMSNGLKYNGGSISITSKVDISPQLNGDKASLISPNAIVTQSGKIYAWGKMSLLPNISSNGRMVDVTKQFSLKDGETVAQLSYSGIYNRDSISDMANNAALTSAGRVLTWGVGNSIGNGISDSSLHDVTDITSRFGNENIGSLIDSYGALAKNGNLYAWRNLLGGAAGNGENVLKTNVPKIIDHGVHLATLDRYGSTRVYGNNVVMTTGAAASGSLGAGDVQDNFKSAYPIDISANFGNLSMKQTVDNVKSVKFGDTEANYKVVDNDTLTVTAPKSDKAGKVNVTITDSYGNTPTLDNAYGYIVDETNNDTNTNASTNADVDKNNNGNTIPSAPNTGAKN